MGSAVTVWADDGATAATLNVAANALMIAAFFILAMLVPSKFRVLRRLSSYGCGCPRQGRQADRKSTGESVKAPSSQSVGRQGAIDEEGGLIGGNIARSEKRTMTITQPR